jgi:branched-subunit amino acid aminotransferase/4-amino-4-deoxychorismate lyase
MTPALQSTSTPRLSLNGREPRIDELAFLAQVNYGHFSSMQVRERAVRGFALHLQRLAAATRELFASELDVDRLREQVRALLDDAPCSLRITVFSAAFDRMCPERPVAVDVLIATAPPRSAPTTALRLRSIVHERVLPAVKHMGTFGLFHALRQARLAGFDDAVFCTDEGELSEGTTWNMGFRQGARIVWPRAPALPGITRQLVDAGLRTLGVATESRSIALAELSQFQSCFILNSGLVGVPVEAIDDHRFAIDAELQGLIESAWQSQPLEPI